MDAVIALLWLACTPSDPMARCDGIGNDDAREDCRLAVLWRLADAGDMPGVETELTKVADPAARDLARVRLAKAFPSHADRLCAPVVDPAFKEKCQQVAGRPHLSSPKPP